MEDLPFEYGFLYKKVAPVKDDELFNNALKNLPINLLPEYSSFYESVYGSNGTINGSIYNQALGNSLYNPIAYIKTTQKIVMEVTRLENDTLNGFLVMSGMSFSQVNIAKNVAKVCRVEVDVNDFIKYFEKVL